jgi:hypothetical protein
MKLYEGTFEKERTDIIDNILKLQLGNSKTESEKVDNNIFSEKIILQDVDKQILRSLIAKALHERI